MPGPHSAEDKPPLHQADVCQACNGVGWLRNDAQPGETGFGELAPCICIYDVIAAKRLARLVRISGMQEQELTLTLDNVSERDAIADAMTEARRIVDDPYGFLTLWGGVGNGKTLILQAVVNELRQRVGMEGAYVRFKDLLDYIRAGFDDRDGEGSERQRYQFLRSVPVLAIDEVDKARMTAYAFEFRSAFLDDRYRLAKAGQAVTLFALNADPREMPPDIYDRLRDGRFVICRIEASSMRPAMRRET